MDDKKMRKERKEKDARHLPRDFQKAFFFFLTLYVMTR